MSVSDSHHEQLLLAYERAQTDCKKLQTKCDDLNDRLYKYTADPTAHFKECVDGTVKERTREISTELAGLRETVRKAAISARHWHHAVIQQLVCTDGLDMREFNQGLGNLADSLDAACAPLSEWEARARLQVSGLILALEQIRDGTGSCKIDCDYDECTKSSLTDCAKAALEAWEGRHER